jgi:hypothetical protein
MFGKTGRSFFDRKFVSQKKKESLKGLFYFDRHCSRAWRARTSVIHLLKIKSEKNSKYEVRKVYFKFVYFLIIFPQMKTKFTGRSSNKNCLHSNTLFLK